MVKKSWAKWLAMGGLLATMLVGMSATAIADTADDNSNADDAWTKLGRGVCNIAFCPFEIPRQIGLMAESKRWPTAVAGGTAKGVAHTIMRAVAGVYEVLTFPIEIPEGYRPIIEPENPFPPY